jgi:metal-sulfur cluster biosynthetic enzyme
MFRAVPLPIIRCSLTVHLALVYVIRFEVSVRAAPAGPARTLTSNRMTYTNAKCTVNELLMMGRGTARNM